MANTTLKQGETLQEAADRTGQTVNDMTVSGGTPKAGAEITSSAPKAPTVATEPLPSPSQETAATAPAPSPAQTTPPPLATPVVEPASFPKVAGAPGDVPLQTGQPETRYGVEGMTLADGRATGETAVRDLVNVRQLFNDFRLGTKSTNFQPRTQTERQAVQMYNAYQKHKDMSGSELFRAIVSGDITPDKNNLLWTSMYQGGKPTAAQQTAYVAWQKLLKERPDLVRASNPVLLGPAEQPTTADIDKQLNAEQDKEKENEENADIPVEERAAVETTTGEAGVDGSLDQFYGQVEGNTTQDQLDSAIQGLIDIRAQTPPEPGFQANLRSLLSEYGTVALQDDVNFLKEDIRELEAYSRERTLAQRDKALPAGVIAGRIGEIERQDSERMDYLNRRLQTATDILNSRQQVVGMLQDAYGNDYNATVANFDRQYSQQMGLITQLRGIRQEDITLQNQVRDDARANLNVLYNNIKEGALDITQLSPQQEAEWAKMEVRAGVPAGTYKTLVVENPGAEIIGNGQERIGADGIKYMDYIMREKDGSISVNSVKLGVDMASLSDIEGKQALANQRAIDNKIKEAEVTGMWDGRPLTLEEKSLLGSYQRERELTIAEAKVKIAREQLDENIAKNVSQEEINRSKLVLQAAEQFAEVSKSGWQRNNITGAWERIDGYEPPQELLDAVSELVGISPTGTQTGEEKKIASNTGDYFGNYAAEIHGSPWTKGVDLPMPVGTPIYAPLNGKVTKVVTDGGTEGFGNRVFIEDDFGNTITLNHLSSANVSVGDRVFAGDDVAKSGNSGFVLTNVGGTYVEPDARQRAAGRGSHLDISIKRPDGSWMTKAEVRKLIGDNYSSQVKQNQEAAKKYDLQNRFNSTMSSIQSTINSALSPIFGGSTMDTGGISTDTQSLLDSLE